MNYGSLLFLGAFLTFASAWLGLVFAPHAQLRKLQPQTPPGATVANPRPYSGIEEQGRRVYQAEGCVYCHTQQVRGGRYQADVERGWGERRSHPQDYIFDRPVLLGTMRTGPDLFNIGLRQPSDQWHYRHLLNPQKEVPGSVMSPYPWLFIRRKIAGQPSADALVFPDHWTAADGRPERGWEVVPTDQAKALVAYLKSLAHDYPILPPGK